MRLARDAAEVLRTLAFIEREVATGDGRWFQVKIMPYRTMENVIDGAVTTFIRIADQKKATAAAEQAAHFAEAIVETVRQPLLILDGNLKVVSANPAFYRHFQTEEPETVGRLIYELSNNQWDLPELRTLLEKIVPENTRFEDFQVKARFPKIGARTIVLNARQTTHKGEATGRILLAFEDITERTEKG